MSTVNFGQRLITWLLLILIAYQLSGCSTVKPRLPTWADRAPSFNIDVSRIPDAVPKVEPRSKYGNMRSYVALGRRYYVMKSSIGYHERGIASWYGMKFYKARTSSGERYNVAAMTAAHRTLPLPTYAQVTNLQNGRRVIVKINDRGPFKANRIMDLSYAAAKKLGILAHGTGLVQIDAIDPRTWHRPLFANIPRPLISLNKPRLYTQIGAFSSVVNARSLMIKIKKLTVRPGQIETVDLNGRRYYRVLIGPLANVDESDRLNHKLLHLGLGKPIARVK